MSNPNTTTNSEQEISNKSFGPTFGVEMVKGLGYDSVNEVLRPIGVDANGYLKVTV
jgi:hypothetical protein